jgi:DNA-binding response OmpR family regulator
MDITDSSTNTGGYAMHEKLKLLIIEDEAPIREGLIDLFVYHGYDADGAADGEQGLQMALTGSYALLVLDIMLPRLDGFSFCSAIRESRSALPVIMLTAKSSEEEIIAGLTLGADDYVTKPFSVRELVLRVEAVLKRSCKRRFQQGPLVVGDGIEIDCVNRIECSTGKRGAPLRFTRREIEVLLYLQENCDRPVSREELLEQVWGYHKAMMIETRTVDIHIAKLRRKIEADPKNPRFLVTLRGEGYRLLPSL